MVYISNSCTICDLNKQMKVFDQDAAPLAELGWFILASESDRRCSEAIIVRTCWSPSGPLRTMYKGQALTISWPQRCHFLGL